MDKMSLIDILRTIRKGELLYYQKDTNAVGNIRYFYQEYSKNNSSNEKERLIPRFEELNLIELPTYEYIDVKSMMSFFTKECVEDKKMRKKLFDTLRFSSGFEEKFFDVCHKYNLYDDYVMVTDDFYSQIAREWLEKNGINE